MQYTVVTFLSYLGQKVSSCNYMPFFIQYHRIRNDLILKVQNLRISPENTPKTMKKILFWIQQGLNRGTSGHGSCMLQKSYGDLLLQGGIFYGS